MSAYDAIIVGAGVAGLTAGRALARAGRRVVVLEARDRAGGRAYTDRASFSRPWDHGCHWIHSAEGNPFTRFADELGFAYATESRDLGLYVDGARLSPGEQEAIETYFDRAWEAVRAAGREGRDVAVSEVLGAPGAARGDLTEGVPAAGRDSLAARFFVAAFTEKVGVEPSAASTLDFANYIWAGKDRPLKDGYGDLVLRSLAGAPVTLSAPVAAIDWSGRSVRVTTPHGVAEAPRVLLTVSTGVLAAEAIAFRPRLPEWKRIAIEGVPMGHALKVGLEFSRDVFGTPDTGALSAMSSRGVAMSVEVRPFGWNGATCYFDGVVARRLEREGGGDAAAVSLAREGLREIFGNGIEAALVSAVATRWGADPFARGAYSAALPGRAAERLVLARPVDDRLFFAGEAASVEYGGDVHGAYFSGLAAAEAMRG